MLRALLAVAVLLAAEASLPSLGGPFSLTITWPANTFFNSTTMYASPSKNAMCGIAMSAGGNGLNMYIIGHLKQNEMIIIQAAGSNKSESECCVTTSPWVSVPDTLFTATEKYSTGHCFGTPVTFYNGTWSWLIWEKMVGLPTPGFDASGRLRCGLSPNGVGSDLFGMSFKSGEPTQSELNPSMAVGCPYNC